MHRRPPRSQRLEGAVAVVFGGGAPGPIPSVGQAAAYAYAAAGARVVVVDLLLENAQRTTDLIAGMEIDALPLAADITDRIAVGAAIDAAVSAHGRIDILHNNVGIPIQRDFADYEDTDWRRGMEVNCFGAVHTITAALPHLLASRGAIVNVSSVAAIRYTGLNYAVYSASKAALEQLTVAIALEFADRGLRANAILPGLLDTSMGRGLGEGAGGYASRAERSPTKTEGDVWDVANAAVFLASAEARYVNAHRLVIDGGLSMRC
jgi:NAD(P)-dependent dehydrogenase (short-subunit alcohol dehydrogenase family)